MKKRETYLAFGIPDFTDAEINAVTRVMRSGWVGMGQETISFEQELADYIGAPEVVTVNSCTAALFLAMLVEGVGPGDEVIVPSLTWYATANAALYVGATPVFCDVDSQSMCATPETIAAKITSRTKAVIVVHYGGYAVDVDALRRELPLDVAIIEDAAHALGSVHRNGKRVGASGNTVCFSFYANKNLSTADGGALALFDVDKAEHLRCLRMSGLESSAWSRFIKPATAFVAGVTELGYKMNFTDLQAAIGRVQLQRLDDMAVVRRNIAECYRKAIEEVGLDIPFQSQVFDDRHARHLLVACFDPRKTGILRDDLLLALRDSNIGASIHYRPLHGQPLYCKNARASLPITEHLAEQIMTLPISARMTRDDVEYVVLPSGETASTEGLCMTTAASSSSNEAEYGFGGRLSADFPSQIIMDITEVCNLACTHCPHPDFARSEHYGGRHLDPMLNEKMIEEVRKHGQGKTQYIRYTSNGEPLIHPNGYDLIQTAVDHSGVYVTLTTNGKIMNEKRTQRLLESGVHLIDISIDAFKPETYAAIRVKGDLGVTRGNVLRLIEWVRESKSKTKVVVSFVEQPQNANEVQDFERYWKNAGASYVVIRRLHSHSGAVIKVADINRKKQQTEARRPCLYPWERVTINARGDLAFCPSDWVHGSFVADYRNTTIQAEWKGEFYQALRQAHVSNNYDNHGFCGNCPDWASTRWPHEGRSYADMVEEFLDEEKL